jgi:membrane protein
MWFVRRARQFVQKFLDDRGLTLATQIAWGLLNTLLPLLLGMLSVLGLLFGNAVAATAVEGTLYTMLPPQVTSVVHDSLVSMEQAAGLAGLISLGLLLFSGSNLFVTLESVFDVAYHVPERGLIKQRLVSFAALFTLMAMVLLGSGVAGLGTFFGSAVDAAIPDAWAAAEAVLTVLVSVLVLAGVFTLMYWTLPNTRNSFKFSLPGGVAAAVLFIALTRLFPLYVSLFGGGLSVYAAFGTVLLFVLWLYLVGAVLVGGAQLNAFLAAPDRAVALSALAAQARVGKLPLPHGEG